MRLITILIACVLTLSVSAQKSGSQVNFAPNEWSKKITPAEIYVKKKESVYWDFALNKNEKVNMAMSFALDTVTSISNQRLDITVKGSIDGVNYFQNLKTIAYSGTIDSTVFFVLSDTIHPYSWLKVEFAGRGNANKENRVKDIAIRLFK